MPRTGYSDGRLDQVGDDFSEAPFLSKPFTGQGLHAQVVLALKQGP